MTGLIKTSNCRHPLASVQQGAHWCTPMPPERRTPTWGLRDVGTLLLDLSNRWSCPSSFTLISTGPNEPVHYVHVWELHLHLPHHDGRHDDVQVNLQNYPSNLIYYTSLQTSQDLVLCEASFQGVWDWSKWSRCKHPWSEASVHPGQPRQRGPGHVQMSHDGAPSHPRFRLVGFRRPSPEGWSCGWGDGHGLKLLVPFLSI